MSNLIVLAGMPGCGKSTWAKEMFDLKYTIICPDNMRERLYGSVAAAHKPDVIAKANTRVWKQTHWELEEGLAHNICCVVDATNLWRPGRLKLLEIGWTNKARCHLVLFKNIVDAIDRNLTRNDEKRVPTADMERMSESYYDTLSEIEAESWDSILQIESYR